MSLEFMSSDDSETDEGKEVLVLRPLPWESTKVKEFKSGLDKASLDKKSPLAKRQMKERKVGVPSSRPKPTGSVPAWVFN